MGLIIGNKTGFYKFLYFLNKKTKKKKTLYLSQLFNAKFEETHLFDSLSYLITFMHNKMGFFSFPSPGYYLIIFEKFCYWGFHTFEAEKRKTT